MTATNMCSNFGGKWDSPPIVTLRKGIWRKGTGFRMIYQECWRSQSDCSNVNYRKMHMKLHHNSHYIGQLISAVRVQHNVLTDNMEKDSVYCFKVFGSRVETETE